MRGDNSPIKHTCPTIDDIVNILEIVSNSVDDVNNFEQGSTHNLGNDLKSIITDINEAISLVEKVREANSILRDWGNEQHDRADYLEDQVRDLESQVEILNDEVSDLEMQISYLQDEIYKL